ncbi:hypothetical protein K458DRAFT_426643 [Lentithecium fluviatile CBS 122367]|uniref:Uncharacterized protein n=1 Tax=Lentithecium fluviatile CBS 122367 TaxID=1168545 RepID=A0A6G1JM45_9PLEO|nr:hypothetical protein K458DRAFT_426643 [Lentithecium fluviatile CBS 122367]
MPASADLPATTPTGPTAKFKSTVRAVQFTQRTKNAVKLRYKCEYDNAQGNFLPDKKRAEWIRFTGSMIGGDDPAEVRGKTARFMEELDRVLGRLKTLQTEAARQVPLSMSKIEHNPNPPGKDGVASSTTSTEDVPLEGGFPGAVPLSTPPALSKLPSDRGLSSGVVRKSNTIRARRTEKDGDIDLDSAVKALNPGKIGVPEYEDEYENPMDAEQHEVKTADQIVLELEEGHKSDGLRDNVEPRISPFKRASAFMMAILRWVLENFWR